ncbi:hypothetical protein M5D96_012597, partial [Drosophila gunungcola]
VLSRKLKPHLVADTVKQYISRAQRTTKKGSQEQQNMEFLRGVYAFMQVDYSGNGYGNGSGGYEATLTTLASDNPEPAAITESGNNNARSITDIEKEAATEAAATAAGEAEVLWPNLIACCSATTISTTSSASASARASTSTSDSSSSRSDPAQKRRLPGTKASTNKPRDS